MTRPSATTALILLPAALLISHCQPKPLSPEDQQAIRRHWAESIYQSLSPKERMGQLFMIALPGFGDTPANNNKIRQIKPGGVILFKQNIKSFGQTSKWLYRLQQERQARTGLPLWITADQENGRVQRFHERITSFPCAMALGRAQRPALTQSMAKVIGLELGAYGLNMNLAPVADTNNNPRNPVIGDRSFGVSPKVVVRQVSSYIQGFQNMGLAAVAKHFPGHGDTHVDSHKALPVIRKAPKQLRTGELVPFEAAIAKQVTGIMSAHILFPALDPRRPATLSPAILTDLLRKELSYSGLIITDDLIMNAISVHYPKISYKKHKVSAPVYAVIAGANIILHSAKLPQLRKIRQELLNALEQKIIPKDLIRRRILRSISYRLGLYLFQSRTNSGFAHYQKAQKIHRNRKGIRDKVFLHGFRNHHVSAKLKKHLQQYKNPATKIIKEKNNNRITHKVPKDSTSHTTNAKSKNKPKGQTKMPPVTLRGHSPSNYWQTRLSKFSIRYGKQQSKNSLNPIEFHLYLVHRGQVSTWARRFKKANNKTNNKTERLDMLIIRTPFAYKNPQAAQGRAETYSQIPADLVLTTAGLDRQQIQILWRSLAQSPWDSLARLAQASR